MRKEFSPRKLIQVKEVIQSIHTLKMRNPKNFMDYKVLRRCIEEIIKLKEEQIASYALTLTEEEVCMLCVYIPQNKFQVESSNICNVILERLDEISFSYLYEQWQHYFESITCHNLFYKMSRNEKYQEVLATVNLDKDRINRWIQSMSMPYGVVESCLQLVGIEFNQLDKQLAYFHLNSEYELGKACQSIFYTLCSRIQYLAIDERALVAIIRSFTQPEFTLFLINFIKELSLKELEKYFLIADFAKRYIGNKDEIKCKIFFKDISGKIEEKYYAWQNYYELYQVFGNDSRSQFWKQYALDHYCNFAYHKNLNLLFLEFKEYIFTEFKEEGPIYLFAREDFERGIRDTILKYSKNNTLRSWLYNGYNNHEINIVERIPHNGRWEYKVDTIIRKKGIAKKG